MLNIKRLCNYFGGVIQFIRDVNLEQHTYLKDTCVRVTPAILYLCSTNQLDIDKDFKLHLRSIQQLEDSEIKELCKLVLPDVKMLDFPMVNRNGVGRNYTIQLDLGDGMSFLINMQFGLTMCETTILGGGVTPMVTMHSVINYVEAVEWAFEKQLDIFFLYADGDCLYRENWNKNDYEKDENA